jgi:hypothetical protein
VRGVGRSPDEHDYAFFVAAEGAIGSSPMLFDFPSRVIVGLFALPSSPTEAQVIAAFEQVNPR